MCRISGGVNIPESFVRTMGSKQARGGPDYHGVRTFNGVSFGHNLLAIIGHKPQPMLTSRYMIVFNGCWYNYKKFYPTHVSDSQALCDHIETHGLHAIHDVSGMFSIAVYDSKLNTIHLIVDRFGQKPLYYYHKDDRFCFASMPSALYGLEESWEIHPDALKSYWMLGSVINDNSLFRGIKKLCASEMLTYDIESNTYHIDRWYTPTRYEGVTVEMLEQAVYQAIDDTFISDVPVHILLSGGIDSTLVASRFEGGRAIHLDGEETVYAKSVSNRFKLDLNVVKTAELSIPMAHYDYAEFCGEPSMSAHIPYIVTNELSKFGRVGVTANGADELFFGYPRSHDMLTKEQIAHIFRDVPRPKTSLPYPFYTAMKGYNPKEATGRMFELGSYVQFDLNKTLDFASMAHGVEMRSPFLQHELVELALSIPESRHRFKGDKTILKDMVRKLGFNEEFVTRKKVGFSMGEIKHIRMIEDESMKWALSERFLVVNEKLSERDQIYLRKSALSFYYWYKVWKHKIKNA